MRPFFSYYGSKWLSAKHYGAPRRDLIVEPFAGSACYSTYWAAQNVRLYDVSPDVCDLWDFLINCSERDIRDIPDEFNSHDEFLRMPRPQRLLCGFWVAKGRASCSNVLSPWYFAHRGDGCRVWGAGVKSRIIAQKAGIAGWHVDCLSWEAIPQVEAHWHVDPPYNNRAGRCYPHSDIDYTALGAWCRSLPGTVDVCENLGADWLPFSASHTVVSSRGRRDGGRSKEAVWSSDNSQPSPMPALTGHLVVQRANGGGSTAVEAPGHSGVA